MEFTSRGPEATQSDTCWVPMMKGPEPNGPGVVPQVEQRPLTQKAPNLPYQVLPSTPTSCVGQHLPDWGLSAGHAVWPSFILLIETRKTRFSPFHTPKQNK